MSISIEEMPPPPSPKRLHPPLMIKPRFSTGGTCLQKTSISDIQGADASWVPRRVSAKGVPHR